MSEPIQIYLHDHYSGSTFAVELLETLQTSYPKLEVGIFAGGILAEVNQDREVLHGLIERIGSSGPDLKDVAAWMIEKASRVKLQQDHPEGLGVFEALETLSLGILGKLALWKAMQSIVDVEPRVAGLDYEDLAAKARDQFSRVDQFRLKIAGKTFDPAAVR